jgi:Fe2+ or Zn2+ uptake regulation protein
MKNTTSKFRRMTKQKSAILSYLKNTKSHPNADTIFKSLSILYPKLSISTVYRNLAQLSEDKIIDKMAIKSNFDHYDANTIPHNHFICQKCGKIIDTNSDKVFIKNLENFGNIDSYCIYFYGICNNCQ